MLCAKFGWYLALCFWRENLNFEFCSCIFAISLSHVSAFGKGRDLSFKQTGIHNPPPPQGCFVPGLVVICLVFLEKKSFKFRQFIFAILLSTPLGKKMWPYSNKLAFPSPNDALCLVWWTFTQWFWRRRQKSEKFTTTTTAPTTTTTDNWRRINFHQKNIVLRVK